MKRIKFFIGAVLLAAVTMFAAGCEQDNAEPTNVSDNTTTADWVDLGLPSGLLWATRNVGASRPEDYGDYFAWGETTPKDYYSWETYRYGSDWYKLTKYCSNSDYGYNGFTDNLRTLTSDDDAAAVNVPGSRMPTLDEWKELVENCTWDWTTQNRVEGYRVTGPNGNVLFLPAAGYRWSDRTYYVGSDGYYWSSSLDEGGPYGAWSLYFNSDDVGWYDGYNRGGGFSVRPVRSAR